MAANFENVRLDRYAFGPYHTAVVEDGRTTLNMVDPPCEQTITETDAQKLFSACQPGKYCKYQKIEWEDLVTDDTFEGLEWSSFDFNPLYGDVTGQYFLRRLVFALQSVGFSRVCVMSNSDGAYWGNYYYQPLATSDDTFGAQLWYDVKTDEDGNQTSTEINDNEFFDKDFTDEKLLNVTWSGGRYKKIRVSDDGNYTGGSRTVKDVARIHDDAKIEFKEFCGFMRFNHFWVVAAAPLSKCPYNDYKAPFSRAPVASSALEKIYEDIAEKINEY